MTQELQQRNVTGTSQPSNADSGRDIEGLKAENGRFDRLTMHYEA